MLCTAGLLLGLGLGSPAFSAVQNAFDVLAVSPVSLDLIYQELMEKAQDAFVQGDLSGALDLFYKAHLVRPEEENPVEYINLIKRQSEARVASVEYKKAVTLALDQVDRKVAAPLYQQKERAVPLSLAYQDMMKEAKKAFKRGDHMSALELFEKVHVAYPDDDESVGYMDRIKRGFDEKIYPAVLQEEPSATSPTVVKKYQVPKTSKSSTKVKKKIKVKPTTLTAKKLVSTEAPLSAIALPVEEQPLAQKAKEAVSSVAAKDIRIAPMPAPAPVRIVETVGLSELMGTSSKPGLRFERGTAVRVEGKNIKRFMVVDEGFIEVSPDGRDYIKITALQRGSTFLHIWDDAGRSTIFVEIIFPIQPGDTSRRDESVVHAAPFRFYYSNDWGAYYQGERATTMERSAHPDFQQTFAMDGDTPLGILDASQSRFGYGKTDNVTTYTVGLTRVPVPGTKELNLRLFDAARSLSSLTFPGTRLRGVFADVDLFQDALGLSVSHGQQQSSFAYFVPGFLSSRKVYVDALRMTLFPKDRDDQVSLNYAKGYGPDYEDHLTRQAYSIEARKKFDRLALNMELARDDRQMASLGGVKWEDGALRTALNVRDINKDYTTVLSDPSAQGEVGATWSMDINTDRISIAGVLDAYRDRLYFNPENVEAFNYDTNAHVNVPLNEEKDLSLDTDLRYVDTPGEMSPRRFMSSSTRLSRSFGIWSDRRATVFAGGGYQKSRYAYAPSSEYDRYSAVCGLQVPLTAAMSCFANYEYSWLQEPLTHLESNPNALNTGISYSKDLNKKLSANTSLIYRNEGDVRGTNSFLAGEDSVALSTGLSYRPSEDVSLFVDSRVRSVWAQVADEPSYHDLDLRMGMRMSWGSPFSLDPAGGVTGFVFKDKNGDGKYAAGEDTGISGVKVKVGDGEVLTDEHGWFRTSVHAKKVVVMPVLESIPQGFIFSTAPFFKVDIFQGMNRRVDFGLTTQSGIYGIVYIDKNGNGAPDKDDQFIGRVQVVLDGDLRQASDARGAYFFKNVAPGKHTVSIDMKFVPMDMIPGVKIKNEVDVSEGTTYMLHIPMKANPEK